MKLKALLEPFVHVKYAINDAITPPTSKVWGERFEKAVKNDWPGVIHKAVAAGISPDRNDSVYYAVVNYAERSLKTLLALKADPNGSRSYFSPLPAAIKTKNPKMVALLLEAKADLTVIYDHVSPLRQAVWNGNTPIVRQLLEAGAPLQYQYTSYGHAHSIDILQDARDKNYPDIIKLLEEAQKKHSAGGAPASVPQTQQAAPPSAVPALVAEIEKLSDEDRAGLFSALNKKFSDDFAKAGKIKILKPLQYTHKPEKDNQPAPSQSA